MRYVRITYYLESLESLNMADVPFAQRIGILFLKARK